MQAADEAYLIGPGPAAQSYLRSDVIVETAVRAGAEAVHPGLRLPGRERRIRARRGGGRPRVDRPTARRDRAHGLEDPARDRDAAGRRSDHSGDDGARDHGRRGVPLGVEIGYPLIIKAAAGGGGKGMKVVRSADERRAGLEAARRQG